MENRSNKINKQTTKNNGYRKLGQISNPDERLILLIRLSYPELNQLPNHILHEEVDMFIQNIRAKYAL